LTTRRRIDDQESPFVESFKVVRPEFLNHYGYLFGGFLLKWVDEIAWIAASRDHPGCRFVTIAMDRVEFHRSVKQGAVLRFDAIESCQHLDQLLGPRLRR
jgi:acyl-CoA hydrolase